MWYLNRVPCLGRDALHGEDDLEGVLGNVPRTHGVQWGLAVDLMAHHHRPEHLEKVLTSINFNSKVHRNEVIGYLLQSSIIYLRMMEEMHIS